MSRKKQIKTKTREKQQKQERIQMTEVVTPVEMIKPAALDILSELEAIVADAEIRQAADAALA